MEKIDWFFVKACILGDGSITRIKRQNANTAMISFTHCLKQLDWLTYKADKLNQMFERKCKVSVRSALDARTNRTYDSCSFALTSQKLIDVYEMGYPNNVKTFSQELLEGLGLEHLAMFWADDGNMNPKIRTGRLNVYQSKQQCEIVGNWIESICGAVGRYEDYERCGIGRLRYPASEMVKIANAITPYVHKSFLYKVDMRYKRNTSVRLILNASSPNNDVLLSSILEADQLSHKEWQAIAKKLCIPKSSFNWTKEGIRQRIIDYLQSSGQ